MSTGAPQSATTVGKGEVGLTAYAEAPTVDLQASSEDPYTGDYDYSPLPTMSVEAAFGLTDNLDLELGLDGVLYFVVPVPLGASLGLRQQVVDMPELAVAINARVGYVQLTENSSNSEVREEFDGVYGKLTGVARYNPHGVVRPGIALTLAPARVYLDRANETPTHYDARSATLSATLAIALGNFELGPFANLVAFDSPRLQGGAVFYTGGFMFAWRPEKVRL